jgi:hypothetical protein
MKRRTLNQRAAFTLAELTISAGLLVTVLGGILFTTITLQRCAVATLDFANGQDDQMRILDYLAVDLRRSTGVSVDATGVVTMKLPQFYNADGTPAAPTIVSTTGWPGRVKKKKKNKHRNIIMSQAVTYNPASTQTVKYYKGRAGAPGADGSRFYREVGGAATMIAQDVADFALVLSEDGTLANMSIAFATRFRPYNNSTLNSATTLRQTVLLRNFQNE